MPVLIVDGANVVGSRPDGWWRDRAGAARRLHEQLSATDLPQDQVVLVLDGDVRRGRPPVRRAASTRFTQKGRGTTRSSRK